MDNYFWVAIIYLYTIKNEPVMDNLFPAHKKNYPTFFKFAYIFLVIILSGLILLSRPYILAFYKNHELPSFWLILAPLGFFMLFSFFALAALRESKSTQLNIFDLAPAMLALALAILLWPSGLIGQNQASKTSFFETFIKESLVHNEPRVRVLATLAISSMKLDEENLSSLIHPALLDKEPLVQQAAKLVIEDSLGISFKNDAEGTRQAQKWMQASYPSALLTKKGLLP